MASTRSAGDNAAASSGRPCRSSSARSPRYFSFQIRHCRSKSRNEEAGSSTIPSCRAAARIARNGSTTAACSRQDGASTATRWPRERPVSFEGKQYALPYRGPGSTQQGKALMSITHPLRKDIPVYLGAEGPKNVELAMTAFDGWFPFLLPPDRFDIYGDTLGLRRPGFEILQSVSYSRSADPAVALLPIKKMLALYVGGMGSKEDNFHKRVIERAGYVEVAARIQELWLSGRQQEAVMAVPDELADALSVTGSPENRRLRLAAWKASPVTTLMIGVAGSFEDTVRNMETLAEEAA